MTRSNNTPSSLILRIECKPAGQTSTNFRPQSLIDYDVQYAADILSEKVVTRSGTSLRLSKLAPKNNVIKGRAAQFDICQAEDIPAPCFGYSNYDSDSDYSDSDPDDNDTSDQDSNAKKLLSGFSNTDGRLDPQADSPTGSQVRRRKTLIPLLRCGNPVQGRPLSYISEISEPPSPTGTSPGTMHSKPLPRARAELSAKVSTNSLSSLSNFPDLVPSPSSASASPSSSSASLSSTQSSTTSPPTSLSPSPPPSPKSSSPSSPTSPPQPRLLRPRSTPNIPRSSCKSFVELAIYDAQYNSALAEALYEENRFLVEDNERLRVERDEFREGAEAWDGYWSEAEGEVDEEIAGEVYMKIKAAAGEKPGKGDEIISVDLEARPNTNSSGGSSRRVVISGRKKLGRMPFD